MEEDLDQAEEESRAGRLETAARILSLLYALVSLLWLAWVLIPEHQRRLTLMRIARAAEKSAWHAASRAARAEMGHELSGRATSYALPYGLSRLAIAAARVYDRMRYSA